MTGDYRILVAIDLKTGTERLLAEAQRYGQAFNATVDILHVAEPHPVFVGYIKATDSEEQDLIDFKGNLTRKPCGQSIGKLRPMERHCATKGFA